MKVSAAIFTIEDLEGPAEALKQGGCALDIDDPTAEAEHAAVLLLA